MLEAQPLGAAEPGASAKSTSESHSVWLEVVESVDDPAAPPVRHQQPQRNDSHHTTTVIGSVRSTPLNSWRKGDASQLSKRSDERVDDNIPPLLGWFVDQIGPTKPVQPKKLTRRRRRYTTKTDMRPEWVDIPTGRSPLTGPSGDRLGPPPPTTVVASAVRTIAPVSGIFGGRRPTKENLNKTEVRVTGSPTGRQASSPERRNHVREADMMTMIDYVSQSGRPNLFISKRNDSPLGGYIGEVSTRETSHSGWIPSQAWTEALRYYPGRAEARANGDSQLCFSGKTHTVTRVPSEHLESDVRTRLGLAKADPEWRPEQLHHTWAPNMVRPDMRRRLDTTVNGLLNARAPDAAAPTEPWVPSYLQFTKAYAAQRAVGERRKKLATPAKGAQSSRGAHKAGRGGTPASKQKASASVEVKL